MDGKSYTLLACCSFSLTRFFGGIVAANVLFVGPAGCDTDHVCLSLHKDRLPFAGYEDIFLFVYSDSVLGENGDI
jgi:hypothetical protein